MANLPFFLSKGSARKLEFLRFQHPLVGPGLRGIPVGTADFGVGTYILTLLPGGDSDSYGTAHGHVGMTHDGPCYIRLFRRRTHE